MKLIIFLILSLMLTSCSRGNDRDIVEIDSSRINKHILDATKQYITEHPDFSSYVIDTNIDAKGYLGCIPFIVSHYDSNFFKNGEGSIPLYPSICFKVNGKTVYIISNLDYLLKEIPQCHETTKQDFVKAWKDYYKDAVMYDVGNDGEVRLETTRPDTVLFRKQVEFEAPAIKY